VRFLEEHRREYPPPDLQKSEEEWITERALSVGPKENEEGEAVDQSEETTREIPFQPGSEMNDDIETEGWLDESEESGFQELDDVKNLEKQFPESEIAKIEDLAEYDPSKIPMTQRGNRILLDDKRIAFAWHATYHDPKKKIKFTHDEILDVAVKIVKEIIRRVQLGKLKHVFRPREMKPISQHFFREIQERVKIPPELIAKSLNLDSMKDKSKSRKGDLLQQEEVSLVDSKVIEKREEDPWLLYPDEEETYEYTVSFHFRAKSVTDRTPILVRDCETGNISVVPIKSLFSYSELKKERLLEKEVEGLETWTSKGWSKIIAVSRHKQDSPPLRVRCLGGIIEVTKDHSLFKDGQPVKTEELTLNDEIDLLDLPKLAFSRAGDRDYAWLLGYFLAEGSYERKTGAKFTSTDFSHLERLEKISKKFGFLFHSWEEVRETGKKFFNCRILGLDVFRLFYVSGCHEVKERVARWKIIPSFVFDWDKETLRSFIEGFLAGDGDHKRQGQKLAFSSSSPMVAQGIYLILKNLYPEFEFSFTDQGAVYRVRNVDPNQRSYEKSRGSIKRISQASSTLLFAKENPNFRHGRYVNSETNYEGRWVYSSTRWVYDIETESHDFLAGVGRIRAHNSLHADLRMEHVGKKYLLGWTIDNQIAGRIKEPVETLKEARRIFKGGLQYSKIDFTTGEWAKRIKPRAVKPVYVSIIAQKKAPQPLQWKEYEGVTFKPVPFEPIPIGACLAPGALVLTNSGWRPIEKVQKGEKVFTSSGNWRTVTDSFESIQPRGQRYFKLKTSFGQEVVITGNHKLLVGKRRWCKNREQRRGSLCIVDAMDNRCKSCEWYDVDKRVHIQWKPISELFDEGYRVRDKYNKYYFVIPRSKKEGVWDFPYKDTFE